MTRRKQKKVVKKRRKIPKLDTEFNCPFCHHTKSISIKLDRQNCVGELCCRVCGVSYSMRLTRLDEAVDVYSSWIDKCIEVNKYDNSNKNENNFDENVTDRGDEEDVEIERNSVSPSLQEEEQKTSSSKNKSNLDKRKERNNDAKETKQSQIEVENEDKEESTNRKRRLHKVLDGDGSLDEEENSDTNALFGGDEDD